MTDAIGNVMDVTDRTGETAMQYRYDAFGNLFTQMAAPYNSVGYTGKTYDAKVSLVDFATRWYSPSEGRFTTEDDYEPAYDLPQSLNRYAYAGNNPVNYTDPTGEYYWCTAVIRGITYSHAPPCDDSNHQVWIPDPLTVAAAMEGAVRRKQRRLDGRRKHRRRINGWRNTGTAAYAAGDQVPKADTVEQNRQCQIQDRIAKQIRHNR